MPGGDVLRQVRVAAGVAQALDSASPESVSSRGGGVVIGTEIGRRGAGCKGRRREAQATTSQLAPGLPSAPWPITVPPIRAQR